MLTLHCIKYNLFLKNKTKVNNRLYHYELFFFLLTSITRRVKFLGILARKRSRTQFPAPFLPGTWNLSTSMDSGVWPTVYGIMPKAKQTSINIFLRNPVPNDGREEENQSPEPEVQVDVIQTENEDADAVPVKKRKTKRSLETSDSNNLNG